MTRDLEQIKYNIEQDARLGDAAMLTPGQWGATIDALEQQLGSSDHRYLVCAYLLQPVLIAPMHSKDVAIWQRYALYRWVGFWQDENGKWQPSIDFQSEVLLVFSAAVKAWNELTNQERAAFGITVDPRMGYLVGDLGGEITGIATPTGHSSATAIREAEKIIYNRPKKTLLPKDLQSPDQEDLPF